MPPEKQEQFVGKVPDKYSKRGSTSTIGYVDGSTGSTTTTTASSTSSPVVTKPTLQKIYGQETQQKQLIETFERSCCDPNDNDDCNVRTKSELTVIAGASGTGKTALAKTLQHHSKYFVLGKCDQFQQGSEPFGPFIVALTQLAYEILGHEDIDSMQHLTSNLENTITESAEVNLLIDMVPALAKFFPIKANQDINTLLDESLRATVMLHPDLENPMLDIIYNFLRIVCSKDRSIVWSLTIFNGLTTVR